MKREQHGKSKTQEYKVWAEMRNRCNNPEHQNAEYYYDKGITVCPEWDSFAQFMQDLGPRPDGMWLERIDNEKPYCKENCKWETPSRQCSNRGRKTNTSGRLGVYWREDQCKWRVVLKVDNEKHNLGQYENFDIACAVIEEVELRLLGYSRKEFV